MKKIFIAGLIGVFFIGTATAVYAAGSKEDAKALVEKAAAFIKAQGKDKALAEFNKPKGQFDKGELYIFVYDMKATVLAHPKNPKIVGKNLLDVPDSSGKLFRKDAVELAKTKGSGWIDYQYLNPDTKKVEHKTSYIEKVDDIIIGCGTYK